MEIFLFMMSMMTWHLKDKLSMEKIKKEYNITLQIPKCL